MAYDLKRFAKLSFDEQMAEYNRVLETGEVDADTLDKMGDIAVFGSDEENAKAEEERAEIERKVGSLGGLSYLLGGVRKAEPGGRVMSVRGICLRFGVYMLVFVASMCVQVLASLHYRVLDFKALWMVLPFHDSLNVDGVGAAVMIASVLIPPFSCMALTAVTYRLRWLMPVLSLWFVLVLGACSGAPVATMAAWAVDPSGEWSDALGYEVQLSSFDGLGYQWPWWLLGVVLSVAGGLVGRRAMRRPEAAGRCSRVASSVIGPLALVLVLMSGKDYMLSRGLVLVLTFFVALFWIPSEFRTCAVAVDDGRAAAYEWDMAFYPWFEFFMVFLLCIGAMRGY